MDDQLTLESDFAALLRDLGVSVLVATGDAGHVAVLGPYEASVAVFDGPLALAYADGWLGIATALELLQYQDVPVARLGHDRCFLPRRAHATGRIEASDLAWCDGELWAVSSRFSCLCVRDDHASFCPMWRPPFLSAIAADDRCHLSGLAVRDGRPAFVTAFGTTDTPGGWRAHPAGGVVLEVPSGQVVASGLHQPRSPRWYAGQLWLLESETGRLGRVEQNRFVSVTRLDGAVRGLDFADRFAFVGLSRPAGAGVAAVDLRTGQVVGTAALGDSAYEVTAVAVVSGAQGTVIVNNDAALLADAFVLPWPAG
jgi:uncharacterized protein (TIGR03032 family)